LPGTLSILDAGREVGIHGDGMGDGIWVGDAHGNPTGYLTYQQFAAVLGETLAASADASHAEMAHAIHH
jgi:hypothetical protein